MIGLLILVLLVALVGFIYLRRPGGRGLFGGQMGGRASKRKSSTVVDPSSRTGGPFSAAAFGGFGGGYRRRPDTD